MAFEDGTGNCYGKIELHIMSNSLIVVLFKQEEENGDGKLVLHLKTKLQPGVPFIWDFHCSKAEEQMVNDLGSYQMMNLLLAIPITNH